MQNYLLAHAQSGNEGLSESLNFTAPQMAGYARKRSHRTLPPLGGATYGLQSSGQTTTIRWRVSGDEFLDTSTVNIKFTVTNNNVEQPLVMVAPAYCFFRRLRVLVNGYPVEEIDDYHRTCALIDACSSRDAVYSQRVKQGWWFDIIGRNQAGSLVRDNSETFVVPLRGSGLMNNYGNRFLPLKYIPSIDLELEMCSLDECAYLLKPRAGAGNGTELTPANLVFSDFRLMFDTVMLDSGIEDQFYKHLEQGNTLDIAFATWRNSRQAMTPNDFFIQTTANVKSARSIFFSVIKKNESRPGNAADQDLDVLNVLVDTGLPAISFPTTGAAGQFYRHGLTDLDIQIGSNVYPDNKVSSSAEFYHYLSLAMNKHNSYDDTLGITWQEYNNDKSGVYTPNEGIFHTSDLALTDLGPYPQAPTITGTVGVGNAVTGFTNCYAAVRNYGSRFICGFNLERLLDLAYSGLDLNNEVIQIKGKCKDEVAQASIMLHYNSILRISRSTIDVLEKS